MAYNRLRTMRDNIKAIRLVLRLGEIGRTAQSAEERDILRKYAGFGGLKCILNPADNLEDVAQWAKSDIELFAPTVELRRLIHDKIKDDKEFARYMDSLKASVLTAFYTPAPVIDSISGSLKQSGIEVRRFLEPSAGQGAFIDSFLRNDMYPGTEVLAYEKDIITGQILSALHPSILTRIEGFEKMRVASTDILMSPPPISPSATLPCLTRRMPSARIFLTVRHRRRYTTISFSKPLIRCARED